MQRGDCSSYGTRIVCRTSPSHALRRLSWSMSVLHPEWLSKRQPFGVISDYFDVDIAAQVQLFRPEHRHGRWLQRYLGSNCGVYMES